MSEQSSCHWEGILEMILMYNQLTLRHITLTLILLVRVISLGNALRAETSYLEEGILL